MSFGEMGGDDWMDKESLKRYVTTWTRFCEDQSIKTGTVPEESHFYNYILN